MFKSMLTKLLRPYATLTRTKKRPERSKRRAANPLRIEYLEDRITPVTFSPGADRRHHQRGHPRQPIGHHLHL